MGEGETFRVHCPFVLTKAVPIKPQNRNDLPKLPNVEFALSSDRELIWSPTWGADGAEAYKGCSYSFCDTRGEHSHKVCPTLNHRCGTCLFQGHRADTGRCGQIDTNLALFEACTTHGYVTANRTRDWGSANVFFTVVRLSPNCTTSRPTGSTQGC
jgi:hypothetical protein